MNKFLKTLSLISLILVLTGCGVIYRVLLGVDTTPGWKSDKQISKSAKQYKIPTEYSLIMDTASFHSGLKEIYKDIFEELNISEQDSSEYFKAKNVKKDDSQPVQFRLFDNQGREIFKMVNCYVDPPIPMSWNVNGCFDTFPAQTDIESLNTHYFDLDFLLENSRYLDKKKVIRSELPQADYYGVILWNDFFIRPSKKLIKTVRKYIDKSDEDIVLLYIDNQNAFIWPLLDAENKEKVKAYYDKVEERKKSKE
jgi:hypothetical protein